MRIYDRFSLITSRAFLSSRSAMNLEWRRWLAGARESSTAQRRRPPKSICGRSCQRTVNSNLTRTDDGGRRHRLLGSAGIRLIAVSGGLTRLTCGPAAEQSNFQSMCFGSNESLLARSAFKVYDFTFYDSRYGVHRHSRADRRTRRFALCDSIGYARTVSASLSDARENGNAYECQRNR